MSRKTHESRRQRSQDEQLTIRRRRWFLGLHILFQVLVVVGSLGPFYTAYQGDEALWTVQGPEFAARLQGGEEPEPEDGVQDARELGAKKAPRREPYEPGFLEGPGVLSRLAMFAAIVAFFFISYDLVADADIQLPALLASAAVCLAAGLALYSIYSPQHTLLEIIEQVEGPRAVAAAADGDVATVTSSTGANLLRNLPRLRLDWGSAMMFSAAPLMLVLSVYLTFFAVRTPERP